MRLRLEFAGVAGVPRDAGPGGRRHDAGGAIDSRGRLPPAKRSQGFALYGIAVVVAPAVGPTLGGWLSDNLSWHWCFLINVPVGLISLVLIYLIVPSSPEKQKERERLWAKGLTSTLSVSCWS